MRLRLLHPHHSKSVGTGDNLWLEREPTQTEIMAALAQHDLSQYRELVFCGYGEPTCRLDDLLWVCNKVRGIRDIPIRVNTNGLSDLINGRSTAKSFQGLVDAVSVSLNASTPEKYVELCHPKYGLDALPAILTFTKDVVQYVPEVDMTVVDNGTPKENSPPAKRSVSRQGRISVCGAISPPMRRKQRSPIHRFLKMLL